MPNVPSKIDVAAINASKILLVEGKDELSFFEEFLKHFHMDTQFDMKPREVGGKDKFPYDFPAFLNDPGFYKVTSYAIIRDADKNFKGTLQSVQNLLKKYKQPCPKHHAEVVSDGRLKVGIFIMPGNHSKGMLEDLCLQVVQEHPVMPYIENLMMGLKDDPLIEYPKNESKAKLQAFLSGMPETVANIGLAAKKGYWQFDHGSFLALHDFLIQLAE